MKSFIVGNAKSKTSWFGTVLAIAGFLLEAAPDFVQQYLPALLAVVPPEYGATLSAIGAAIIALRNVTKGSVTEKAAPKASGFARLAMLVIVIPLALALLSLTGCAAPGTVLAPEVSTAASQTAQIIARGALRRALENDPRAREKARNIRKVIEEIGPIEEFTTVTALRLAVDHEVGKLDLTADEKQDADELLDVWQNVLAQSIKGDEISGGAIVKVEDILQSMLKALPPAE